MAWRTPPTPLIPFEQLQEQERPRERTARNVREQRDRAEHYERIYKNAINDMIERLESQDDFIDCIEDAISIGKRAKAARW